MLFSVASTCIYEIFSVIRRLMTLLAAQASLAAASEAALRQASSASKAAEELMAQQDKSSNGSEVKELQESLTKLKEELGAAKKGKFSSFQQLGNES